MVTRARGPWAQKIQPWLPSLRLLARDSMDRRNRSPVIWRCSRCGALIHAIAPRSLLLERWSQVAEEPLACQARYLLEGSGLFEEMRGAGNDREAALAPKWP